MSDPVVYKKREPTIRAVYFDGSITSVATLLETQDAFRWVNGTLSFCPDVQTNIAVTQDNYIVYPSSQIPTWQFMSAPEFLTLYTKVEGE